MRLNRYTLGNFALAVACVVGGAAVGKYLDAASGAILSGFGGLIVGRLLKQPEAAGK